MKKSLIFFIAVIFFQPLLFTQTPWTYREQVSGVTTNLTGASSIPQYYYQNYAMVCGSAGVVLKTTNAGINWINVSSGGIPANVDLYTICVFNTDTAVTAGNTGAVTYVYRTVNGGLNWSQVFTQSNGKINAIALKNSQLAYMTGNPVGGRWSLWKSTNKGLTWDSTGMYIPQAGSETGFANSLSARHNFVVFGTNNSRIYRSTNNGTNWSFMISPEINSNSLWIYSDTSGFPAGYAYIISGSNNLFRSTNLGVNWAQSSCPDSSSFFVGFAPGIPGVYDNTPYFIFAVRNNNKVYFTYGTNNFTSYYSAPAGNYNHLSTDYTQFLSPNYLYAVRTNGGITRIDNFLGGGLKQLSSLLPDKFELSQNYPNPFNPVTNIRFAVKKYGLVRLMIYDVSGREVYGAVDDLLKPGTYEVNWDASSLSSGIYFYSIRTEGFTATRKMILVK